MYFTHTNSKERREEVGGVRARCCGTRGPCTLAVSDKLVLSCFLYLHTCIYHNNDMDFNSVVLFGLFWQECKARMLQQALSNFVQSKNSSSRSPNVRHTLHDPLIHTFSNKEYIDVLSDRTCLFVFQQAQFLQRVSTVASRDTETAK